MSMQECTRVFPSLRSLAMPHGGRWVLPKRDHSGCHWRNLTCIECPLVVANVLVSGHPTVECVRVHDTMHPGLGQRYAAMYAALRRCHIRNFALGVYQTHSSFDGSGGALGVYAAQSARGLISNYWPGFAEAIPRARFIAIQFGGYYSDEHAPSEVLDVLFHLSSEETVSAIRSLGELKYVSLSLYQALGSRYRSRVADASQMRAAHQGVIALWFGNCPELEYLDIDIPLWDWPKMWWRRWPERVRARDGGSGNVVAISEEEGLSARSCFEHGGCW
ncbi:hypothetical protein CERSUDRAFT_113067 [Gelatoporia subvermispora B]|uniref:Uncharacterized protein n=1 Tax=Ceriporiopsis subvermispora (strain B) TaxID=914234 RepID=M2PS24_CERS8|nr:hypothetical protein CERSUDRAFT_113067 [Gelatoporia subvermispora B]